MNVPQEAAGKLNRKVHTGNLQQIVTEGKVIAVLPCVLTSSIDFVWFHKPPQLSAYDG